MSMDLAVVDALARLQLEARRAGLTLVISDPADDLLVRLCGLDETLRVQVQRQPEQREERRRVEKERELGDPPVDDVEHL